ncbi:MAG: tape measure protein [Treponema sp.]|nr:tape measure protein [Treponema sp.]
MADKKTLELQITAIAAKASQDIKNLALDVKNASDKAKGFTGDSKAVATSIKSLQEAAARASTSLKLFGGSSNDLQGATQKLKATILDLVKGGLAPESKEIQNLVAQYRNLEQQTDRIEAREQGFIGVIAKLRNEIGSLAVVAAAVTVDRAVGSLVSGSLAVNNSFQKAKDDFGIMLNDMEAGAGLFNELQEFNFWTPFDIEQTSQAAKVLIGAKVPLSELTEYLTRFGDIAQGDAQRFQSFINAFSKASAKGKADMEVLNVYIDQGVQILDALATQLGVSTDKVIDMASKGKISFQDFNSALEAIASEGGLYYGTLEKAAMRLDAVQAGLDESVKSLKASFGQMLAPVIAKVLEGFTNLIDAINASPLSKGLLAAAITSLVVIINTKAVIAIGALIAKLWAAYAAQMGLNSALSVANPALIAVTATVAIATAGFVAYAASQQKAADATATARLEAKKLKDELTDTSDMNNMSAKAAQIAVNNYKSVVAEAQKKVDEAKKKLAEMPETTMGTKEVKYLWLVKKFDVPVPNPEREKAAQELKEQEEALANTQTRLEAMTQKANQLLSAEGQKIASFGSEWQSKINSVSAKIDDEENLALVKLAKHAEETLGAGYENNKVLFEAYEKEKTALTKYYAQKRADEEAKYRQEVDKWLSSGTDLSARLSAVESRMNSDVAKLKEAAKKAHVTQEEYIKAEASLRVKYAKEARALVMSEHDTRMKNIKEEAEYRAALARNKLDSGSGTIEDVSSYVGNKMYAQVAGTDLGELMSSFTSASSSVASAAKSASGLARSAASASSALGSMGGPIASIVLALVQALMKLENVQKVFGMFGTIVNRVVEIIGPIVNSILEPIAEYLEALGDVIGQFLKIWLTIVKIFLMFSKWVWVFKLLGAACEAVANAFNWFYEKVITPVGNMIIDTVNQVIDVVNTIPGVNIKKFDRIGDNADKFSVVLQYLTKVIEEEVEKQKYLIEKKYQRLIDSVDELLNSKLKALESRYELGLISRSEYESQAQQASAETAEKTYDLQKAQESEIAAANAAAVQKHQQEIALLWYGHKAGWFDVGSPKIERDQVAVVHKGETIVPKTFAEGIRSGELTLSGRKSKSSAQDNNSIVVNVRIEGSVVTENQLIDSVYKGIAAGIQQRKYSPFPGATA